MLLVLPSSCCLNKAMNCNDVLHYIWMLEAGPGSMARVMAWPRGTEKLRNKD